jgi:hypothetical protein
MYPGAAAGRAQTQDPDLPALAHLHECEYSATGYFGNEGSEVDFYIYGALHVAIPPYGEGARVVGKGEPPQAPASALASARRARTEGEPTGRGRVGDDL